MRGRHVLPAVVVLALADPAAAVTYAGSGYALSLRASAVSADLGTSGPAAGVTVVDLGKERGREVGRCETVGAGVFARELLQQPEAGGGPAALTRDREALAVPTGDRDLKPSPSPGEGWGRRPDVLSDPSAAAGHRIVRHAEDGPGVRWHAKCDNDAAGEAIASSGDLPGIRAAGSATTAQVDRRTMQYVGTARAFVADVSTASGVIDLISSVVTVTVPYGAEPRLSYRIAIANGPATSVLAAGENVPLRDLAGQFEGAAAEELVPTGLTLAGPTLTTDADGTRTVHAPVLQVRAGDAVLRLAAVSFSTRD